LNIFKNKCVIIYQYGRQMMKCQFDEVNDEL